MKESGKCPHCNSEDLEYDTIELESGSVFYPFTCNNCNFRGREWYDLTFTGFTDTDGNEVE